MHFIGIRFASFAGEVWRAHRPLLLAEWLLPVVDLKLEPGAAFTFKTQLHFVTLDEPLSPKAAT